MTRCLLVKSLYAILVHSRHIVAKEKHTFAINQCWLLLFQCLSQTFQLMQKQVRSDCSVRWLGTRKSPFNHQSTRHKSYSFVSVEVAFWFVAQGPVLKTNVEDVWGVSYRIHFSSLLSTLSNLNAVQCKKVTRNRLTLAVACYLSVVWRYPLDYFERLSYAVHVKSDCFIRNLESFGKLATLLSFSGNIRASSYT